MVTSLHEVIARLGDSGLRLLKAIPRGPDQLNLEIQDSSRGVLTGQWHRDPARSGAVAADVEATCGAGAAWTLDHSGIVLLEPGADPRLPALRTVLRRPGAQLVAHRLERRAVVREAHGDYTKVMPPELAGRVASALFRVRIPSIAVPRLTDLDVDLGTVTTAPLPGRTFHAELGDHSVTDEDVALASKSVGAAVRELHQLAPSAALPLHDVEAELRVCRRWLTAASDHGLIPEDRWRGGLERASALLGSNSAQVVTVHRDLHEKQVMILRGQPVGLLDLDLLGPGDPALDIGNLLAHFELRALHARSRPDRPWVARSAFLEGYAPGPRLMTRAAGYVLSTRLRLAAVYAFRDAPADLIEDLLNPAKDRGTVP